MLYNQDRPWELKNKLNTGKFNLDGPLTLEEYFTTCGAENKLLEKLYQEGELI